MNDYFKNSVIGGPTQFIPPDYGPEDDAPDEDIDESIEVPEDDDAVIQEHVEETVEESKTQEQVITQNTMSNPFGNPPSVQTPSFGSGTTWGSSGPGTGVSSPWASGNNNSAGSSFGFGQQKSFGGTGWGMTAANSAQKEQIDRNKKVIIIDFLDCIAETYQSNNIPGFTPRDIFDLRPRFDVWSKLSAFNSDRIYMLFPTNLIPNTNGAEGWEITLTYYCCCLSAYLRMPYRSCQVIAQTVIGQPKEDTILEIIDNPQCPIDRKSVVLIGIYSGTNGQSNRDLYAAQRCGIDYLDLGQFLNNMY